MKISVLTIVRGRQAHLENQLKGLLQSQVLPHEWIVVGMNQEVEISDGERFPIRTSSVDHATEPLPLALARNHAASLCQSDGMIFLDVDCIPSPSLIGKMTDALQDEERLWMGRPRYLPAGATEQHWQADELPRLAVDHPLQPSLEGEDRLASKRYELFWSLCFAISRSSFETIGGFDESFDGYGGEDTDFSFSAREAGVPFGFLNAVAYHQHHAVCKPPLNHLQPIVQNAERFKSKWGVWPMESWLKAFAERELIEFHPASTSIRMLRLPTPGEIEEATTMTPAGF
ncbi:glycosyltransferase family 2 protein [Rhodopirellula bahusiensis]|uniref:glycosyltransferase family 2 protein n=1 Tax=Rhodopirellula bahusiensis TaxID=2014065 RepID=UPI003262D312